MGSKFLSAHISCTANQWRIRAIIRCIKSTRRLSHDDISQSIELYPLPSFWQLIRLLFLGHERGGEAFFW